VGSDRPSARLPLRCFYAASGATHGHDSSDRIVYDSKGGQLYYDSDGSGSHGAVQFALLTGIQAWSLATSSSSSRTGAG